MPRLLTLFVWSRQGAEKPIFVFAVTFGRPDRRYYVYLRVLGLAKLKHGARVRRPRTRKIARVAGVRVDQLVMCPSCGEPMHLSELSTFTCKHCIRELTAEQALTLGELPGA
jgi:hypothetical protein